MCIHVWLCLYTILYVCNNGEYVYLCACVCVCARCVFYMSMFGLDFVRYLSVSVYFG